MGAGLDWDRHGADWPNAVHSRFVEAGGLTWHVQIAGTGPALLLLHGTGAGTHSWRDLLPLLAERFTVIAPDLPGHAFTARGPRAALSLPGMARALAGLCESLGARPALGVGHSAGAAVLVRMALDGLIAPRGIVGVNGALRPFRGMVNVVFPAMARMLFVNPLAPRLFATQATPAAVDRLMRQTGSRIDAAGLAQYRLLLNDPGHVGAALGMMAQWDLDGLVHDLRRLDVPMSALVGMEDRAIPPAAARWLQGFLPDTAIHRLDGLGHLAHEEAPARVARLILDEADRFGAVDGDPAGGAAHGFAARADIG